MFTDKSCEESQNILCKIIFSFENRAVYWVMWKNTVQSVRQRMTKWGMRIACWLLDARNTLTICNTYCISAETMVARTRLKVTLYVHLLFNTRDGVFLLR
jgi:hypothetical protein